MLPWFLREPDRFRRERRGIEELARSVKWLVGFEWLFLEGDLCLDAVIRAHAYDYEVRVYFPLLFPEAPAVVRPRNVQGRLSRHQYGGADGPLCLEWGPDNWHRDVTAVQMIESTQRLFEIENPLGQNRPELPVVAPSRHRLTIGQELRGKWARWYYSEALRSFLAGQPQNSVGSFRFSLRNLGESWAVLVHEAMPLEGETWRDAQIPSTLPKAGPGELLTGIWFKTDLDATSIGQPDNIAALRTLLEGQNASELIVMDGSSPIEGFQGSIAGVLISDRSEELHFFIVLSSEKVILYSPVRSEKVPTNSRSPESANLSGKCVGIVGLGSAGSKIAVCLARMGVRKFYLADHDLLLPENLQRHALDWQSVTIHKVDAVVTSLHQIAADIQVDVTRYHLTGQESNAVINGVLQRLGNCDLIIDATASSKVFNLLAAVARIASKPMVWLEIFGGGVGGLIARSRPEVDPSPQEMRIAYLQYCSEHPDLSLSAASEDYAIETADGEVLTASDADVAIIAHHAARLVPDCFISQELSKYPYSMYLIGLAKAWVFEAPFATIPISTVSLSAARQKEINAAELDPESVAFLVALLKKSKDESSPTS